MMSDGETCSCRAVYFSFVSYSTGSSIVIIFFSLYSKIKNSLQFCQHVIDEQENFLNQDSQSFPAGNHSPMCGSKHAAFERVS